MNCSECQEYLLEADPELLTGIGDEPIAAHIRSCEVCRDLAMAMLSQLQRASLAYARRVGGDIARGRRRGSAHLPCRWTSRRNGRLARWVLGAAFRCNASFDHGLSP